MANERHGLNAELKVQNSGGTMTALASGSSMGVEQTVDTAEVSHFSDTAKRYLAGLSDGSLSYDASYTVATATTLRGIVGLERNFEAYPGGNVTGQEKITGACILTSLSRQSDVSDAVKMSVAWQISGAITVVTI